MTEAFPLKWPVGRPRTADYLKKHASFKITLARAQANLITELKRMQASNVVITTNVGTYRKGGIEIAYSNQKALDNDCGVAVYYSWKNNQYCLCCDKWKSLGDNMQALVKTVNAIRGIERWGSGDMVQAAFAGFKALPQQAESITCWQILKITSVASIDDIKYAYRQILKTAHPDAGGSQEEFLRVQKAFQECLNNIK